MYRHPGDLLDEDFERMEVVNPCPLTLERMATCASNVSHSPEKRMVKSSSYLLSPYMNKKTTVVPKITRLEFILGNNLFATQGGKIENVFETHYGAYNVYPVRLNMETLTSGLWIDANVVDCRGVILNYEERFREAGSPSRHFFSTSCILFGRLLKFHGHKRHAMIGKVKPKIPKLKWRTKGNFKIVSELQCDMMRRLRFKFSTKILLHELNVYAEKMLKSAMAFDKVDYREKMSIIVEEVRNKKKRGFNISSFTSSLIDFNFTRKSANFTSSLLNKNKQSSTIKFASLDIMKLISVDTGLAKLLKKEFSLLDLEVVLINPNSISVPDDRYAVSNGSRYAILICWDEYAVLDRELDTPYPMEVDTPYSTVDQNSTDKRVVSSLMDTAYWMIWDNAHATFFVVKKTPQQLTTISLESIHIDGYTEKEASSKFKSKTTNLALH
ncbi:hypothetical protein Tco_1561935 [Tanacetum coccineum]